ncbi:hypothetical protein ACWELV_37735, partial [Streptomyces mirabilis]
MTVLTVLTSLASLRGLVPHHTPPPAPRVRPAREQRDRSPGPADQPPRRRAAVARGTPAMADSSLARAVRWDTVVGALLIVLLLF